MNARSLKGREYTFISINFSPLTRNLQEGYPGLMLPPFSTEWAGRYLQ